MTTDNLFEIAGKPLRRVSEALEDASSLFYNCIWDHSPGVRVEPDKIAKQQSGNIAEQVRMSLWHGDLDEAAHQLRRQLYFCSNVDGLSGTKNELAARAGLKAIQTGSSPIDVSVRMDHAADHPFRQGYFTVEPDQIDKLIGGVKNWYNEDPEGFSKAYTTLAARINQAEDNHKKPDPDDLARLALMDFGYANIRADLNDLLFAQHFYSEGTTALEAAKKSGMDTSNLEEISFLVNWQLERMNK